MSLSNPVALTTMTAADPVHLGPSLEAGASGSVGARRLRDMPEVWAAGEGTFLMAVDADGAVTLLQSAQLSGTGYLHTQLAAATTWDIAHGLGYNPAGIVIHDSAGDLTEQADVIYLDPNTLRLAFASAISGTAELS